MPEPTQVENPADRVENSVAVERAAEPQREREDGPRGLLGAGVPEPPAVPVDAASGPDMRAQAVEQRLAEAGFRQIRGAWRR